MRDEDIPAVSYGMTRIYFHRVSFAEWMDYFSTLFIYAAVIVAMEVVIWINYPVLVAILSIVWGVLYYIWTFVLPTPNESEYWEE